MSELLNDAGPLESTTADELFDDIAAAVATKQRAVAREYAADVENRISIDVQYVNGHAIRSRPGEAPRRDSANLFNRIHSDAVAEPDHVVEAAVWSDAAYAADLEARFRLVITHLVDSYIPAFVDAAVSGIEKD
jgi:hypothetical protein